MIVYVDVEFKLEVEIQTENGKPDTGLTIPYEIRKSSDNSLVASGTMLEEHPGTYVATETLDTAGQYRAYYLTPVGYEDGFEPLLALGTPALEETLETILTALNAHRSVAEPQIQRILGLVQENFRIFNPVYNSNGNMTAGTIKIYASAADCNGDTDPIATYSVAATYNQDKVSGYKVTKQA